MKPILIAASILAVSMTAAEAKCSKKALNGSWMLGLGGPAVSGTATNGVFTFAGGVFTMTLTSYNTTKCKGSGTGTNSGSPFTFTFSNEAIPGTSANPDHFIATLNLGGTVVLVTGERT